MEFLTKHSTANNSVLKISATLLFIALPIIGFVLGMKYQAATYMVNEPLLAPLVLETPKKSNTAVTSWKRYTNAKYGYSIDYPSDWVAAEFPSKEGASFQPENKTSNPDADSILVNVQQKTITDPPLMTFEEYAKVAAKNEIQNYDELASIEKIYTTNGIEGFKTTWFISSMPMGNMPVAASKKSESGPITYFEVPNTATKLIQITDGANMDKEVYNQMIATLRYSDK